MVAQYNANDGLALSQQRLRLPIYKNRKIAKRLSCSRDTSSLTAGYRYSDLVSFGKVSGCRYRGANWFWEDDTYVRRLAYSRQKHGFDKLMQAPRAELPQYLHEAGWTAKGYVVACTQVRLHYRLSPKKFDSWSV